MEKLNHLWRIIATGICFVYFGLGALVLSLCVFPLQQLTIKDINKKNKAARKTVHLTFKWFISFMAKIGVFQFELSQVEKLKQLKGHLVLANHPSLIDVVVLISIIPNADCVVKAHLFKNPFLRGVVKNTGYISNADPEGLLKDCQSSLAAGNNLIIFPEGTRSKPGKKLKFQRGAANIALRCQAKIAHVMIHVSPTTLTKSEPWYNVPAESKALFRAKQVDSTVKLPPIEQNNISKQVRQYSQQLELFYNQELIKYEQEN
jgi:1-acyl-sn-glycerol-3-phosphate acyltransferase